MLRLGREARRIYANRPLASGHPDIAERELPVKTEGCSGDVDEAIDDVLSCVCRAVDAHAGGQRAAVIGCGPLPGSVRLLGEHGWTCVGVEPVEAFVLNARDYLGKPQAVLQGSAEDLPLEDESQDLLIMESVLEHVDSPLFALNEAYRVLTPGGLLYVCTTNRWAVTNGEYTVRFFQWLPKLVKESYIHQHLHFAPELARYTSRPAVHWFSYADLCGLGRNAGFYRFYSKVDLMSGSDTAIRRSRIRACALDRVRYNPWLRSLVLTQKGGNIFMLKRPA